MRDQNIFAAVLDKVRAANEALIADGVLPAGIDQSRIVVEPPRESAHGDMATNAAMVLAKPARLPPRVIAEKLAAKLAAAPDIAKAEIAGPGFVNGLKTQGIGLFLWGAVSTTIPLILGMFIGKFIFRFHDALLLGIVSGARTTTASLGLVCDRGQSQVPALGYTVTYAVGNTLLTIWGMVLIMLLS